jgi:glucosylceramidase
MDVKLWVTNQTDKQLCLVSESKMRYINTDAIEEQHHPGDIEAHIVNIHDDVEYQTFGGIGGAFTDTSATVWKSMPEDKRQEFIRAYFDRENGIGYTLGRLSIASCDFSTEDYTYVQEGDETLETFDISHDKKAVFPMVHAAMKYTDLTLFASPWSPPAFMKTNTSRIGGHLKKEHYELWAKYFKKYIDCCKENNINIWAVTIQNEPRHHQMWESCLYTPEEESEFLSFLGKELENSNVKIFCYDHCRERVFERAKYIYEGKNGKYCDGIANHWYSGDHFGELKAHAAKYPQKISIASEGCCVINGKGIKPELELSVAEKYAYDIIGCFNNGLHYYCDWNLLLDENNGPHHNRTGRGTSAESAVYYLEKENKILYRLAYYYIGHISKFVHPGAKIIACSSFSENVETTAFKNNDGGIVCVLLNRSDNRVSTIIRIDGYIEEITLEPHSIATVVIQK